MHFEDHGCVKFAFILTYAALIGIVLYKILMGYCEKHNVTVERNPMFADCLRGAIAGITGIDIALLIALIAK